MSRALWYTGCRQAELRQAELGSGSLRLRMKHSAISRGTEGLVWRGEVPESEWAHMRAPHQEGSFPFPVKYGYCGVAAAPDGTLGFVLHPHQDVFQVDPANFHPLPHGVPADRAILAANLETALNAVWDAGIGPGDRVGVVGAGVVGCLVAYLAARIIGTEVHVVDVLPARQAVVEALGATFGEVSECDGVFHTSATSSGLSTALRMAGQEATVVELSWYGSHPVQAPLGHSFHRRRITLRSSQVGQIPPTRQARWSYTRRLRKALQLLSDPVLGVLINSSGSFAQLPTDLSRVLTTPTLCHRVDYREGT